jgi:hypothetical protein
MNQSAGSLFASAAVAGAWLAIDQACHPLGVVVGCAALLAASLWGTHSAHLDRRVRRPQRRPRSRTTALSLHSRRPLYVADLQREWARVPARRERGRR